MTDQDTATKMPQRVAAISACGYAIWASEEVDPTLRAKIDDARIRVAGVRNVRVWSYCSPLLMALRKELNVSRIYSDFTWTSIRD
jgi:hypothetical protein